MGVRNVHFIAGNYLKFSFFHGLSLILSQNGLSKANLKKRFLKASNSSFIYPVYLENEIVSIFARFYSVIIIDGAIKISYKSVLPIPS